MNTIKMTTNQRTYLFEAAYGYLNGFNDCGPNDYPPMTMEELKAYTWDTIDFERRFEPEAQSIYFIGKDKALKEIEAIIRSEDEFGAIVTDWKEV